MPRLYRQRNEGFGERRKAGKADGRGDCGCNQSGLGSPQHFEELGVLQERIGADRISDATCTILKPKLIEYTQAIAQRHGIALDRHRLYASQFDTTRQRFISAIVEVPTNPVTEGPLLFVPERFLDELPTLNPDDWWASYENERLRTDLNYEVMGKVDKATIVATAREHMESVRTWAQGREGDPAQPYDMSRDQRGWSSGRLRQQTSPPKTR